MHSSSALVESSLFLLVEFEFNYLLDAVVAEDAGNAYAKVFVAIFALEQS